VSLAQSNNQAKQLEGKRVAMVMYSSYPSDPRPRRAIDALIGEGAQVDLICLGQPSKSKGSDSDAVRVSRVPIKHKREGKIGYLLQYGSFLSASSLLVALRSFTRRYDLVYVHNMPDILVMSALVPKLLGAKVVLDLHDPMPELMTTIFGLDKNSLTVGFIRSMEKWSIARATLVVTVNLACWRIFASRSCKAEKIIVVMNAPDSKIFPFRPAQEQSPTKQTQGNPFVMMYHGSMVERNGLDLAVEAFALIREKMPNAELRVFGPTSPFLERVLHMVQTKNLQDVVHYLGPRKLEDLAHEIEACDVGVIPNQRNPFTDINTPTRIFEYLAIGKPVIAPNTPGIRDYFDDQSLIFFEPGNAESLAKQMERAYWHRDELAQIAFKGQQIYLAHTWEQERQTLLDGVNRILI
jgi:glycosyltransferase involved in cell wall biosynthesis